MGKYNGVKPAAQPRSLRSVAETNTGEFPTVQDPSEPQTTDVAEQARPTAARGAAGDKQPFANLRGGK